MCFGVRDAITMARHEVATQPLTILGELVHNATVLDDLGQRGVQFEIDPKRVATDRWRSGVAPAFAARRAWQSACENRFQNWLR